MTRRVYHLVENKLSTDTVQALRALSYRATRGQIIGIAYVVMYKGREYTAGTAGECSRNPTFTRGMLQCLDDSLAAMTNGG